MAVLRDLKYATKLKISIVLSAFILSSMLSITMNVPVLPTPALENKTKQCRKSAKKKNNPEKQNNREASISTLTLVSQFEQGRKSLPFYTANGQNMNKRLT